MLQRFLQQWIVVKVNLADRKGIAVHGIDHADHKFLARSLA
jgi:hypothetical protein